MPAAKDTNDNENPDWLNQVVEFTKPIYLFTNLYVLLLLSVCLPLDNDKKRLFGLCSANANNKQNNIYNVYMYIHI